MYKTSGKDYHITAPFGHDSFMKYLTVYKNALSSFLQYRMNLGLLLISHMVSLTGLVFLWISIYAAGQTVGSYTLEGILFYYIALTVLRTVVAEGVGMAFEISQEINQGIVANYMLKPFSYTYEQFYKFLGKVTINAVFITPIVLILVYYFRNSAPFPGALGWLQFLIMGIVSALFYFLIYYFASLSSFWLINGRSAVYGMLIASNLLNGSLLPLDLFPLWFQHINNYLPFQYLIFVPIQALLGRIEDWTPIIIGCSVWVVLLTLLIKATWNYGIKKFEAVGR